MTVLRVPYIECESCDYKGPAQFKSGVDGVDDLEVLFGLKIVGSKTIIIPCPICGKKNEDKSPEWMKWVV